jgi:hypothetical protein
MIEHGLTHNLLLYLVDKGNTYQQGNGKSLHQLFCEVPKCNFQCATMQCTLWGFNGGDTNMGNLYKCLHVDVKHQSDLGFSKP